MMERDEKVHPAVMRDYCLMFAKNEETVSPPSTDAKVPPQKLSFPKWKPPASTTVCFSSLADEVQNDRRHSTSQAHLRVPDAVGFRQNVMEFLQVMYGSTPLDDSPPRVAENTAAAAVIPSKEPESVKAPNFFHVENCSGLPQTNPAFPLRRVSTHHVFREGPPRISRTLSAHGNVSEDHLDTLLLHILKGYKQMGGKGSRPAQRSVVHKDPTLNVSLFVNQALDKYLVKETSFSVHDAQSSWSSLSAAGAGFFPKLLSFQPKSQISFKDDDSETLVNPGNVGKMAVFLSVSSPAARSVSKSLPPGPLLGKAAVFTEKMLDMAQIGQRNMNPMCTFEGSGTEPLLNMNLTHRMSLKSNEMVGDSSDSWIDDAPVGARAPSLSETKKKENTAITQDPPATTLSRPLHEYFNSQNPKNRPMSASESAQYVIREEDLKRSVLMAVERRLRDYINSLHCEVVNSARRSGSCQSLVLSGTDAAAHPPMVQNLIDFFHE